MASTSPFSFVDAIKSSDSLIPAYNVSPINDMVNGEHVIGPNGVTYLNGGACRNNAVCGGNNTQKTGEAVLQIVRMLFRIPTSISFIMDIEATLSIKRMADMYDRECGIPGYFMEHVLNKRLFYFNRNDHKANPFGRHDPKAEIAGVDGTWVHNFFKDLNVKVKEDIKAKKDIYITTPYLGNDGLPIKLITPIITFVDSISEMHFHKVSAHFQDGDVDEGGEKRTRDMAIGNMKRIVYEDADVLGGEVGCVQFWTAQVVETINMSGRPQEKESVFIRPGKKLKGPKSLMRIPQVGWEIIKGSALKSGQEWLYPNPFGRDIVLDADAKENPDLLFYPFTAYRNKSGSSGGSFFFIGSQSLGIQEGLTMYHAMKTNGMFGLEGSAISHACVLYPELKLGRTTIWEKTLTDPKLERALTICYQMLHMQAFWLDTPKRYRLTPQELYTKIKEQGYSWDDILENTVYYWHTNPEIKQHTVSTMELLKIAIGERKPYWLEKAAKK
jgi:hypothetical protein